MTNRTPTRFEQAPVAAARESAVDLRAGERGALTRRRYRGYGPSKVAQVSNLLYRRFLIGRSSPARYRVKVREMCRLEACDTAGWKPALSQKPTRRLSLVTHHLSCAAFSLLEILVAVGLLSVIIIGLLSMFYQTEKAFRIGTRQVDVLESGRAVMELLVRELQEITSADDLRVVNLFASTNFAPVIQPRPGVPQYNYLQDYYFVTKRNDLWTGVAYYVEPVTNAAWPRPGGVGSLYRYTNSVPGMFPTNLYNLYNNYQIALSAFPTDWHRVSDNIIHLRIIPYDRNGIVYTNINLLQYAFPYQIDATRHEYMPSSVDLEVGILEPRALERYRTISDPVRAAQFLTEQADKVHLFRQRIPVRTSR